MNSKELYSDEAIKKEVKFIVSVKSNPQSLYNYYIEKLKYYASLPKSNETLYAIDVLKRKN